MQLRGSYNPACAVTHAVWAVPLPLAATHGITLVFFSCGYLDVSVPRVRLPNQIGIPGMRREGCPIRKSADQIECADPRSLSQLATSFFASGSPGIPRAPLFTYFAARTLLPVRAAGPPYGLPVAFSAQHVKEHSPAQRPADAEAVKTERLHPKKGPSRKEVFQPHLPVRLPCYDLAPVTGSTLNGSLRLPSSGLPDSHGLTGGVYKVRERIHRAVADARLLAIPASRGRVAGPDPN
jgi:hypothetical protein